MKETLKNATKEKAKYVTVTFVSMSFISQPTNFNIVACFEIMYFILNELFVRISAPKKWEMEY